MNQDSQSLHIDLYTQPTLPEIIWKERFISERTIVLKGKLISLQLHIKMVEMEEKCSAQHWINGWVWICYRKFKQSGLMAHCEESAGYL